MDPARFDDLLRALTKASPRRAVLRGLGAAVLGALGTSTWLVETIAGPGCKNVGTKCKNPG